MMFLVSGISLAGTTAVVTSVYDGDTFTLEDGTRVRLAHVNTPELAPAEPYAAAAQVFAEGMLAGRSVTLEHGPDSRDTYGRLVATVMVDGRDLGTELVRRGLGHVFAVPPGQAEASLLVVQDEARAAGVGLWSATMGPLKLTSFHANGRGDDATDPNVEYFRLCNLLSTPVDLTGWVATDPLGRRFSLPGVHLPPGAAIAVHSGMGRDDVEGGHIYLGSPLALWPDEGAHLLLMNPEGRIVDRRAP